MGPRVFKVSSWVSQHIVLLACYFACVVEEVPFVVNLVQNLHSHGVVDWEVLILEGLFNAIPSDQTIVSRYNHVLLSYECGQWDGAYLMSLLKSGYIFRGDLEHLRFIGANVDSVPHVPFQAGEDDRLLVLTRNLTRCKLSYFIAVRLLKFEWAFILLRSLLPFTLHKSVFKSIEVNLGVWKYAELFLASGIEHGAAKLRGLHWQFCRRGFYEDFVLNVIDRNSKVWHSANNQ